MTELYAILLFYTPVLLWFVFGGLFDCTLELLLQLGPFGIPYWFYAMVLWFFFVPILQATRNSTMVFLVLCTIM